MPRAKKATIRKKKARKEKNGLLRRPLTGLNARQTYNDQHVPGCQRTEQSRQLKEKKRVAAKVQKEKKRLAAKSQKRLAAMAQKEKTRLAAKLRKQYEAEKQDLLNENKKLKGQLLLKSNECERLRSQTHSWEQDRLAVTESFRRMKTSLQLCCQECDHLRARLGLNCESNDLVDAPRSVPADDLASERNAFIFHLQGCHDSLMELTLNEPPVTADSQDNPPSPTGVGYDSAVPSSPRTQYGPSYEDIDCGYQDTCIQRQRQTKCKQLVSQQ